MIRSRRQFLAEVGQGMLVAGVGSALALDLGLAPKALADDAPRPRLTFGAMEPLVAMMQSTPADKLLPLVVSKLQSGTDLRTVVAAAALANARAFGGHDYDGYHTFMALLPAYQMAQELPEARRALPILKVLHRNSRFIQNAGAIDHDALHALVADGQPSSSGERYALRDAMRQADQAQAERSLATIARGSLDDAYQQVQSCVQDEVNVHRVVLSWRAWAT